MNNLQNISFDKLLAIYEKYFSLGYLNTDVSDKLACISLTCYITNELRNKGKKINCYEVLLQIGKDMTKTQLREEIGFSTSTLAKMSKDEYISLKVIDDICEHLECKIEDVIEIKHEKS